MHPVYFDPQVDDFGLTEVQTLVSLLLASTQRRLVRSLTWDCYSQSSRSILDAPTITASRSSCVNRFSRNHGFRHSTASIVVAIWRSTAFIANSPSELIFGWTDYEEIWKECGLKLGF